ncbi:GNAT family N-acetyltransferase [Treponema sp.]|uniref:GNAT family N-acetyltransferase n=1 Tax=Treponema sp. TaxID=166 RepID=UPI00388E6C44
MAVRELLDSSPEEKRSQILNFLIFHEEKCVSLVSRFLKKDAKIFYIPDSLNEEKILAVFSYSAGGQILHCFDFTDKNQADKIHSELTVHFKKNPVNNLFSIIGESSGTNFLTEFFFNIYGVLPETTIDYSLMKYYSNQKKIDFPYQYRIIQCTEEDLENVFPLQKKYELEEVVVDKSTYKEKNTRIILQRALKSRDVFAMSLDGKNFVSKLSFNAKGINCIQLGGIYTDEAFRNRGIAGFFVKNICDKILGERKTPVLFVKNKNSIAFNVYKNCGFEVFGEYKIVYY